MNLNSLFSAPHSSPHPLRRAPGSGKCISHHFVRRRRWFRTRVRIGVVIAPSPPGGHHHHRFSEESHVTLAAVVPVAQMMDTSPSVSPTSGPRPDSFPSTALSPSTSPTELASHDSEPASRLAGGSGSPPPLPPIRFSKSESAAVSGMSGSPGGSSTPKTPRLKSVSVTSAQGDDPQDPIPHALDPRDPVSDLSQGEATALDSRGASGSSTSASDGPPLTSDSSLVNVEDGNGSVKGLSSDVGASQRLPPVAPILAFIDEGPIKHDSNRDPLAPTYEASTSSTSPESHAARGPDAVNNLKACDKGASPGTQTESLPEAVGVGRKNHSHTPSAFSKGVISPGEGESDSTAPEPASAASQAHNEVAYNGQEEENQRSEGNIPSASHPASVDANFRRLSGAISLSGGIAEVAVAPGGGGTIDRASLDGWSSWKSSENGSFSSETGAAARGGSSLSGSFHGGGEDGKLGSGGGSSRGLSMLGRNVSSGLLYEDSQLERDD